MNSSQLIPFALPTSNSTPVHTRVDQLNPNSREHRWGRVGLPNHPHRPSVTN